MPDMLLAARNDGLPEELQAAVTAHLGQCHSCAALSADLDSPEMLQFSPRQAAALRDRVFGALPKKEKSRAGWFWWVLPVPVAALLLVGIFYQPATAPPKIVQTKPVPEAPLLVLTKPPVRLPAAAVLLFRSGEDASQSPFLRAIAAFRSDNFEEAARLLLPLVKNPGEPAETHFYLGVSLLFAERYNEAIAALDKAASLSQGELARDAAWYLALGHYLRKDNAAAAATLQPLCRLAGAHQAEACAAVSKLSTPPAR
jgi:tetratricopeptide (TPR) repeat protein